MRDADGRLLRHPRLRPDESLASWLVRLSVANGYADAATYTPSGLLAALTRGAVRPGYRLGPLGAPKDPALFARLAALTGAPIARLHAATPHRFAPLLAPPARELAALPLADGTLLPLLPAGRKRERLLHPDGGAQFCPACLREDPTPYHRLLWAAVPVAACLRHRCLLVAGCPACGAATPVHAVIAGRCLACGAALPGAPGAPLPGDGLAHFSQATLQAWLLGLPPADPAPGAVPLPAAPPRALFRVVHGLRVVAQLAGARWPYPDARPAPATARTTQRLGPADAARLYAAAFQPLLDWPRRWHAFLDAFARLGPRVDRRNKGGGTQLGHLYGSWIQREWRGPAFAWLQEEVDHHLLDRHGQDVGLANIAQHRGPTLGARRDYLPLKHAAALLGVPQTLLVRLLAVGRLTRHTARARQDDPARPLVARAEVLVLRDEVRRWIGCRPAAALLGVAVPVLDELVARGTLPAALASTAGGRAGHWYFDSAAVAAWRDRLLAGATPLPPPAAAGAWLPLWRAVAVLHPIGWTTAALLARVADGTVRAYRAAEDADRGLAALRFARDDLHAAIAAFRAERGWLASRAAAARVGIDHRTFATLVARRALVPVATIGATRYFAVAALDHYVAARAVPAELGAAAVGRLLGVSPHTIRVWAGRGWLPILPAPAAGRPRWRFDRTTLAAWRADRLTFAEAAALSGFAPPHLHELVARGQLTPLFGDRRAPWFARDAVERLREALPARGGSAAPPEP